MDIKRSRGRPRLDKESERAEQQLEKMQEQMKELTVDEVAKAPVAENPPQTKITVKQFEASDAPVIRASKTMPPCGKPNPKCEEQRKRGWEYVKCIAENNEIVGEILEFWLCKFPGDSASYWQVPTNRPIYLPRHVAEHLASRKYHRFVMTSRPMHEVAWGEPSEKMVAKQTHQRLDCRATGFETLLSAI